MGKHLFTTEQSTVQIQNNNPGCMGGMFQILDYHHWRVKKIFPHKKTKHARHKRKTILHNQGEEDQQNGVEAAEPLPVRQHGEKLSATGKSSHKNSKKEPHTVKRSNEENSGKNQANSEYVLHLEKDSKTTEGWNQLVLHQFKIIKQKIKHALVEFKKSVYQTSVETIHHTDSSESPDQFKDSTFDELEADLPNGGSVYPLPDSLSNTNASVTVEDTNKSDDNHFLLFKSDADKDSNFKYVKEVLEFSGFMGNEHIQMPYTVDQPINPSLFMDLEASLSNEIKSSEEEIINPYDHQLLFNLVNEALREIYERSPFNHRLHPMPKGNYLLNQVWTSVNSYLSSKPELDQKTDDVVARDLAKRSGWMNLQHEEECVALELDEMIIDDLLDEIFFS